MSLPIERPEGVAYGKCWCGCGEETTIAPRNQPEKGWVKDEPIRWRKGHHRSAARHTGHSVVDCGFDTPCHLWTGCLTNAGYGTVSVRGRRRLAHNVAWEVVHGPQPTGTHIDHLCRNTACVNVRHLELVTPAENARRGAGTRLTKAEALAIRDDRRPIRLVAGDYGISKTHVRSIRTGRCWGGDLTTSGVVEPGERAA